MILNLVLDRIGRAEREREGRILDWQSVWEGQQDDDNEDLGGEIERTV